MKQITADFVRPTLLEKILSLFGNVRPGEGLTVFLLMTNVFTLLTAYYIVKPVREALILGEAGTGGAEIKSYASAVLAAMFIIIVPLYGYLASRVNRLWLINGVTAFFISNLIVFFILGGLGLSLGVVFFLWVGLFNVFVIAQFWALANDVYSQKKGERLFGVVGIGSSLGAIFGALLAGWIFEPLGPYSMMLLAAALLGVCMVFTNWIHHREKQQVDQARAEINVQAVDRPLAAVGGFQLIFKHRYLLLIAGLVLLTNFVNTTGEFILGKTVEQTAESAGGGEDAQKTYIGEFYSNFYFWVNLLGAVIQMFVVSRVMQHLGIGAALFFLPVIALGSYTMLVFLPVLSYIRIAKILENSADYSIQNTARHALFLPTSREAKYKAKAAVDTFFWRAGDTFSGLLVFVGTQLALDVRGFAAVNVALVIVWLGLAFAIIRFLRKGPSATRMAA